MKIIWSNTDLKLTKEDKDFIKEEYPDIYEKGEEAMYEFMEDYNNSMYDDECINLNIILDSDIICIAKLGRWNGTVQGYKMLNNNLSEILKVYNADYIKIYYDGHNVKAKEYHHDGTNYFLFRKIRDNVNIENFLNKIYNNEKITNSTLNYYTKSLKEDIKHVYRW